MNKDGNVVISQFELKEDDIDKIVEGAKNDFVEEIISDLGLNEAVTGVSMESGDFKELIGDVFDYGTRVGVYSMLELFSEISDKTV